MPEELTDVEINELEKRIARRLEDEDEMSKEDVDRLSGDVQKLTAAVNKLVSQPSRISPQPVHAGNGSAGSVDTESLYHQFKARLIEDAPMLIKTVIQEPELMVQVERVVLDFSGNALGTKISQLIADGFFNQPMDNAAIHKELKRRGVSYDNRTFGLAMQKLSSGGALTIEENGYQVAKAENHAAINEQTRTAKPVDRCRVAATSRCRWVRTHIESQGSTRRRNGTNHR